MNDVLDRRGIRPLLIGNEWITTRTGGLNRYLADLSDALERAGAEPTVVVVGDGTSGPVKGASSAGAWMPARLMAMRRAAVDSARSVNVVDAHFALYALLPIVTTRLRRLPLVVHFQGPWADESAVARGDGRVVRAVKRAVERAVYRRADTVVVLSEPFGRIVQDRYGVEPSRVVVVPPGVDLHRFLQGDRAVARRSFGIDQSDFVAVAVRRLDARMGLDVLVEAWAKVQTDRNDAVLLVAGEGREHARLEAQCALLPNPAGVRFLGRVSDDELVSLYQAADISVVPTRALEGFGLVTLESLACGTPPVVTDVGGLPDGVRGLDQSLVVLAEDADALADRIHSAAAGNVPSRDECRAHAETFAWDQVARRHLDIYRQAMGDRPLCVVFVGHTAALSGGELALARVLPALKNVEAHVILGEDGPLVNRLRSAGATVEVLEMSERSRSVRKSSVTPGRIPLRGVLGTVVYSLRLGWRLRQLRPDIVHTNTLKAALYGGVAGRLAGVPVVWHIRDRIAADYLPRPAVALVRMASRFLPAMVITNSEATLRALGRWPRRSAVVPSPMGVAQANDTAVPTERPLTVGIVGRLSPWKGQDLFLRAFARAFPEGDTHARVVGAALFGEDEWAATLPHLAAQLGIADRVDFVGFVDEIAGEYARLDVLVHASTVPEPFGQVVVEGMAAGLAVLASDAGGPAEIITDGVDGLLYPMGDEDALVTCLQAVVSDPELRIHLGLAAEWTAVSFAPGRVADMLKKVYCEVACSSAPVALTIGPPRSGTA